MTPAADQFERNFLGNDVNLMDLLNNKWQFTY
jgi:hypothetical protein